MRPLTDEQWARLAPCLPRNTGKAGRPFADQRRVVEGIIYRYRTGIRLERSAPRSVRSLADGVEAPSQMGS
jgi:transposase